MTIAAAARRARLALLLLTLSTLPAFSQGNPAGEGTTGTVESGTGQPVFVQGEGWAQAGVGQSGPGKLVDLRHLPVSDAASSNKLEPGAPSDAEKRRLAHFAPGKNFRQAIVDYTAKFSNYPGPPFLQSGSLAFIDDEVLARQLPGYIFYVLRFRVWPVAFAVPAPLHYNNIFAFDANGRVVLITESRELSDFFRIEIHGAKEEQELKNCAIAWMRCREELAQDGMYRFSIDEPRITNRAGTAVVEVRAKVGPQSGNMGELAGTLTFDAEGKIAAIQEFDSLKPGIRPICQSSKLLDPDPVVRKMAEQDLLIMGRLARPYLDYQRPRVSPELQKAIDRLWQRIEAEGR